MQVGVEPGRAAVVAGGNTELRCTVRLARLPGGAELAWVRLSSTIGEQVNSVTFITWSYSSAESFQGL